jgi:hypothetical protein
MGKGAGEVVNGGRGVGEIQEIGCWLDFGVGEGGGCLKGATCKEGGFVY